MNEEQNQNSNRNLKDSDKKLFSESVKREKTPTDQSNPDDQKKNTGEVKDNPYNIIVNIPEKKDKSDKAANIISLANVFVAAILAIFTYLLFRQAADDSITAQNAATSASISAQASVGAAKDQHAIYITDSINNSIRYKLDSANYQNNFNIAKNALITQINSLKQTQKDFEI